MQTQQANPVPAANNSHRPREKSFPKVESGKWTGTKLADGQPDISGQWTNTIGNHGNFEDPQGGVIGESARDGAARPLSDREMSVPQVV